MISKKMRNISMVCLSLVLALSLAFGLSSFSVKKADAAMSTGTTYEFNFKSNASDFPETTAAQISGVISVAQTDYELKSSNDANTKMNFTVAISTVKAGGNARVVKYNSSYGLNFDRSGTVAFSLEQKSSVVVKVRSKAGVIGVDPYFGTTYTGDTYQNYGDNSTTALTKDAETTLELDAGNYKICCPEANGGSWRLEYIKITPLAPAYSYAINSVTNPTGEYSLMQGQDLSYVDLPTEVTGTVTSDDPDAPATVKVPVTKWTADTSAVGTVVATGTLGSVEGYTLGVETVTANLTVKEIEKIEITSFDAIDSTSKVYGTAQGDLGLPATVTANDGSVFGVTWTIEPEYTGAVGNYTATGTVKYDETYYTVTAANPTVAIEITAIAVESQVLEGTYYTFDNANVLGLPTTIPVSGVDFEISWGQYADGVVIGTLVEKTGYDVSNAKVTANVELVSSAKSINFGSLVGSEESSVAVDQFSSEGYTLNSNASTTLDIGKANETNFRGLKIKNSDVILTFFVKGEANVSFAIGNGAFTFTYTDVNGNNQTDTASAGAHSYAVKDSKCTLQRNGSSTSVIKYINIDDGNSTTYSAFGENNQLPATAAAKEGYEFIGWQYNNNLVAPNAVVEPTTPTGNTDCYGDIYTAVYAKADYLGVSFKTTGASIRYGFILEIVNANGEALSDEVLKTLKSSVTGKFIFTTPGKANEIDVVNLGAGTVTSSGVQKTGIIANLVITNMSSENYSIATTTSITLKLNGVEFTANSGAAASAQACAQVAFNQDMIKADVAASFGVTSKTNIN